VDQVQPNTADRHEHNTTHLTGIPPPNTKVRPHLELVVDENELAASQLRHPSSYVDPSCGECGFIQPRRSETGGALRRLPSAWRTALRANPQLLERAAFLRDEIHAVTNRVARLLVAPRSRLQRVTIRAPTANATSGSQAVVVDLLRFSAERLARIVDSLRLDDWGTTGYVGDGVVTVADLIHVPLHHSHRDLVCHTDDGDRAVVVPLRRLHAGTTSTKLASAGRASPGTVTTAVSR
jgi:hypothetical protein